MTTTKTLKATGKALFQKAQKDQTVRKGRASCQITNAARIDMIGTVVEIMGDYCEGSSYDRETMVRVRIPGWLADGYHMDTASLDEICFVDPKVAKGGGVTSPAERRNVARTIAKALKGGR